MTKPTEVEGVRLKFRTEERGGRSVATATIWVDDKPLHEVATLDLSLVESPGDASYQGWVDSISAAFGRFLRRKTGIEGLGTKRRKPRYAGE